MVVLNVETKQEEVDVNITPDKRQILFENEKFLLATIRFIFDLKTILQVSDLGKFPCGSYGRRDTSNRDGCIIIKSYIVM